MNAVGRNRPPLLRVPSSWSLDDEPVTDASTGRCASDTWAVCVHTAARDHAALLHSVSAVDEIVAIAPGWDDSEHREKNPLKQRVLLRTCSLALSGSASAAFAFRLAPVHARVRNLHQLFDGTDLARRTAQCSDAVFDIVASSCRTVRLLDGFIEPAWNDIDMPLPPAEQCADLRTCQRRETQQSAAGSR